jgi:hypothetical protein
LKTISSTIYSNALIQNRYQTISVNSISGITGSNIPLATLKNDGTWTTGVIYVPYFLGTREEFIKWKKTERKNKLEKLNKLDFE